MPAVIGNGLSSLWPFEQDEYEADLAAHRALPSPLRMTLTESGLGDFTARVYADADVSNAVFVMVAVLGEDVPAAQGSLSYLPYHAKLFLTGSLGDPFSIAGGDSAVIRKTFDPDPAWTYADMGVVCWIQQDGGTNPSPSPDVPIKHEVLQAAYAPATATSVHGPPAEATAVLSTPSPNPSRDSTRLRFSAGVRCTATVAVYDVSGRCVAVLFDGIADPGVRDVVWDGTDASGRRCPSGVYFVRLSCKGPDGATRKVVLVR